MPLFLADAQLYRARLFGDRQALAEARRLCSIPCARSTTMMTSPAKRK